MKLSVLSKQSSSLKWIIFILILSTIISFSQSITVMFNENEISFENSLAGALKDRHIAVAAFEVPVDFVVVRNSTGHVIHSEGIVCNMIDWLSAAYSNSAFSIAPINIKTHPMDTSGNRSGIIDLLRIGVYDIMTAGVPTPSRTEVAEFTNPILYPRVSYLIPLPISSLNVLSFVKPFQIWVWVGIFSLLLIIIISLKLITKVTNHKMKGHVKNEEFSLIKTIWIILGLLLHQVVCGLSSRLSIRIIIASWSLVVLVLIHSYTCLLTAFVTAPNPQPLIRSIKDLKDRPDIRLITDKNLNTEAVLLSANSGFLKFLGDKLREDSQSRCLTSSQCVASVKQGHAVYTATRDGILAIAMKNDSKASAGKCDLQMGKGSYMELQISWVVQKKSPILDSLNKSFMRMTETGLTLKWSKEFIPKVEHCYGGRRSVGIKRAKEIVEEEHAPFTLKGLSGPFILFFSGIFVSWLILFAEMLRGKL